MWFSRFKLCLSVALISFCASAQAHRFHAGITDISMNARSGNTEIIHTFMTHDVEALLENLYQRPFDLSDPDDITVFRQYVEKQFQISDHQGQAISITWVGVKVNPEHVMIFQELLQTVLPEQAHIKQAILTDFLADQVNTINIKRQHGIQSLQFHRQQREHKLSN